MKRATRSKPKPSRIEGSLDWYDWSKASQGRYAGRVTMGTPMRRLDEDLTEAFPNSAAVNAALRAIVTLGKVPVGLKGLKGPKGSKGSRTAA